jgi:hypothetical protein
VFAAVTDDGRVHVYDLHQNRLAPLCVQRVAKPGTRLTKVGGWGVGVKDACAQPGGR